MYDASQVIKKISSATLEGAGQSAHVVIADYLRCQITSGSLTSGQRLDSESTLCARFSVSRGPVRQALAALGREGLIHRVAGKGSFVTERVRAANLTRGVMTIRVVADCSESMLRNAWFGEVVDQLNRTASQLAGRCRLAFHFHPFVGENDLEAGALLGEGDCQGALVIPLTHSSLEFMARWRPRQLPTVALFRRVSSSAFSQVYVDQEEGAFRAVQYLIKYGHRRIGMLIPLREYASVAIEHREAGYRRALESAGIEFDPRLIEQAAWIPAEIRDRGLNLLRQSDRPTALLIGGSGMLKSAQQAVFETSLKVPDQLSVITFDDVPEVAHQVPPLTAVKMPIERAAKIALERLLSEIRHRGAPPVTVGLASELVVRDSCSVCGQNGSMGLEQAGSV